MPSFIPRPFPPPSLADVPVEYIYEQLHSLGAQYWDKPETADCTIIVPIPHAQNNPLKSLQTQFPGEPSNSVTVSFEHSGGGNRRATQPPLNAAPRLSLELHMDYLSAHSTYLRGLFSGALPLDLMYSQTPPASSSITGVPSDRQPRLMPSSPDHPILFLPLPDPSSFHLLAHYMYFGDLTKIADCLHRGVIQWEGIARNVEYLGLTSDIKLFLSKWYSTWLDGSAAREAAEREAAEDSDTAYSDSDDDDNMSSATESDLDEELADLENLKEPPSRGRDTVVRPLMSFQSFAAPQAAS